MVNFATIKKKLNVLYFALFSCVWAINYIGFVIHVDFSIWLGNYTGKQVVSSMAATVWNGKSQLHWYRGRKDWPC